MDKNQSAACTQTVGGFRSGKVKLTFRKAAKAEPKCACVLVRSRIHVGSLASVAARE